MALYARLHIQGHTNEKKGIRVLSSDIEFLQEFEPASGAPAAKVNAGKIDLIIAIENDAELLTWMLRPSLTKNGKIVYSGKDNGKIIKTLEFTDALLVRYHERFREFEMTTISITITAKKLKLVGALTENRWSLTD
jgi:hypothetical protein